MIARTQRPILNGRFAIAAAAARIKKEAIRTGSRYRWNEDLLKLTQAGLQLLRMKPRLGVNPMKSTKDS